MSGAVGSIPSFTRSGRRSRAASASLRSRPPAGRQSTALRASQAACSAGVRASGRHRGPNARLPRPARPTPPRPAARRRPPSHRRRHAPRRMTDAHGNTTTPTRPRARLPRLPPAPPARARPAAHQEAAGPLDLRRARAARVRLDGLRDDDGGRLRPAAAREPRAVPREQEQLGAARLPRPQARDPHEQPERRARRAVPDRAGDEARDDRDRGQALLHQPRLRPEGHRARAVGRRRRRRRARRAPRRSRSSSSRSRWRRRTTAPSSRSCARRRSPTT